MSDRKRWYNRPLEPAAAAGFMTLTAVAGFGLGALMAITNTHVSADCVNALESADQVISLSGEGFDIAAEGFYSVSLWDVPGLDAAVEDLSDLQPRMVMARAAYESDATACNPDRD